MSGAGVGWDLLLLGLVWLSGYAFARTQETRRRDRAARTLRDWRQS